MKKNIPPTQNREVVDAMAESIEQTLNAFDVPIKVVEAIEGLHNYHFHLKTLKPIRMRVIESFEQDLRYALGSDKVEIQAPIPDQNLIGITIPKKQSVLVLPWREAVTSARFLTSGDLVVPLGRSEFGEDEFLHIQDLPHLLIGGTTGSGKTELLHSIINSLIIKHGAGQCRFILVDLKRTELHAYSKLPHLLTEVIHDPKKVVIALKWCIKEMERRLDVLVEHGCQNISSYHKNVSRKFKGKGTPPEPMPFIMVVIDELADLMALYPKEIEACLVRLAQMSRAVGIHLILSTQRPTVNVVTGLIKANIPTRIALQVASQVDSRTILDQGGAEKLVGKGDMLFLSSKEPYPKRMQGYYLSEEEVQENIAVMIQKYEAEIHDTVSLEPSSNNFFSTDEDFDYDAMYEQAKALALELGKISTSYIQRRLKIGYSRAVKFIDMLEERGVITEASGSKPREVVTPVPEDYTKE